MTSYGRRGFLLRTAAAALAPRDAVPTATQAGMRLGLIVSVGNDPEGAIARVHDLGLPTCQASVADFGDAMVRGLRVALERHRVEATAINTSGPGPQVYDFCQGPQTIGVVPRRYRRERIDRLKRSSDFAKKLGIPAIHTHCGFIPEDPIGEGKADFPRIIARLKQLDYRGPITIEREISGPKQIEDIRKAKEYLEKLMA